MNNAVALYNNYFDSYEKTYDQSALNEKEGRNPDQFKIANNELPKWLKSKNDFNEVKRLVDDIRIDMNKDKVNKEDKKVFNNSNKLIIDKSNNKIEEKDAVERLEKYISDLEQLGKKQNTDFQNKMIHVVYELFDTLGFNKEFEPLFSEKIRADWREA